MDRFKFYDVTHRHHLLCNPVSVETLDEVLGLCGLEAGSRVLDIGCGKGEVLARLAETYRVRGVGVDLSPYFLRDAEAKLGQRAPGADIRLECMDAARYSGEPCGSFDLAMCIGVSWIFGGHKGTLRSLKEWARPGGLVLVGEPFWRTKPPPEYLDVQEVREDSFSHHEGNIAAGCEEGLSVLFSAASSDKDWDRYEGLQWFGAAEHQRNHPDDPDFPEIASRVDGYRVSYLRHGRDTLGFALYLFRTPA